MPAAGTAGRLVPLSRTARGAALKRRRGHLRGEALGPKGPGALGIAQTPAGRLHIVPRYRRKVSWQQLDMRHPGWVDDPDFDLAATTSAGRRCPAGNDSCVQHMPGPRWEPRPAPSTQELPRAQPRQPVGPAGSGRALIGGGAAGAGRSGADLVLGPPLGGGRPVGHVLAAAGSAPVLQPGDRAPPPGRAPGRPLRRRRARRERARR